MSWQQIEHDDTKRVPLVTYRCRNCRRLAVATTTWLAPTPCICKQGASK
jgi:hypothetical protein